MIFDDSTFIAEKNDPCGELYFLTLGKIEVVDPEAGGQVVQTLEPGAFFGEGCLFAAKQPFSYRAVGSVHVRCPLCSFLFSSQFMTLSLGIPAVFCHQKVIEAPCRDSPRDPVAPENQNPNDRRQKSSPKERE